jgi:hypothetical protein
MASICDCRSATSALSASKLKLNESICSARVLLWLTTAGTSVVSASNAWIARAEGRNCISSRRLSAKAFD